MSEKEPPLSGEELRKKQIADKVQAEMKADDLKKRIEAFNKELLPLLGKYKLGLAAEPMCLRLNNARMGYTLGARPILIDASDIEPAGEEKKEEGSQISEG